ncbi:MAG TPA: MEDS domain-containing protein [Candidatus Saccharimonadales bacterium]|nr:MEDS domain-containing protein [Candidatus Saccharimonadales bacterium]
MFPSLCFTHHNPDDSSKPKNYHPPHPNTDDENILVNPVANTNIILIYENELDLDNAISTYLNEGLKRGQICVYASVSLGNNGYLENFSSHIVNYQENVESGNLKLVDLASYYVNTMVGNLKSFDNFKKEIISILEQDKNRVDKHVRVTEDCATLLFKNKRLHPCMLVKEWCRRNPLEGSYLCPYPRSLLNQFPYNNYVSRILNDQDIIIESNGKLISFIPEV